MSPEEFEDFFKEYPPPIRENNPLSDFGHIPITGALLKWMKEKGEEVQLHIRTYGTKDRNDRLEMSGTVYYFTWKDTLWSGLGLQTFKGMDDYLKSRYSQTFYLMDDDKIDDDHRALNFQAHEAERMDFVQTWKNQFYSFYQKNQLQNNLPDSTRKINKTHL